MRRSAMILCCLGPAKKVKILVAVIALTLICAVAVVSLLTFPMYKTDLPPEFCANAFECTPQQFLEHEFEYSELNAIRKNARISGYGELSLRFSKQRGKSLLKSEWVQSVHDDHSQYYIFVDRDLTRVTFYSPYENDEFFIEQINMLNKIVYKIHFINFLNRNVGKKITIVQRALNTGQEVTRFELPYSYKIVINDE